MDLDDIKRGLRAEIKKRENAVSYVPVQCSADVQDVLAKLEEQESEIAELKAQKAQAEDDCAYWKMCHGNAENAMHETEEYAMQLYKEARHHKYKRCLAMAEKCESEYKRLEAMSPIFDTDKEYWEYNSDYWFKWHERWLALAEKFKEEK